MARQINRLSARAVTTLKTPGRHADGGNLYLVIDESGARRWVFLYRWRGRLREMGLGGVDRVSLTRAREKASAARAALGDGIDPIAARRATVAVPTFGEAADAYIAAHESSWRNAKHVWQWRTTLTEMAASLRPQLVNEVDTAAVLAVLQPMWGTKRETANRLRGRIELVLDSAKAAGHRTGDNPARWRGHLDTMLAKKTKLAEKHYGAMPYADVAAFIASLRSRGGVSALALEFVILTAARSGEVLGARWGEIDLKARLWVIPAERTKTAKEHRVPLSRRALAILEAMAKVRVNEFVFPGARGGLSLSNMALVMLMRKMKITGIVPHGFRSSFRDWAGDATTHPREIAEAALGHQLGNEVERSYRRSDALDKRRKLMNDWASFVEPKGGKAPSDGEQLIYRTGETAPVSETPQIEE